MVGLAKAFPARKLVKSYRAGSCGSIAMRAVTNNVLRVLSISLLIALMHTKPAEAQ